MTLLTFFESLRATQTIRQSASFTKVAHSRQVVMKFANALPAVTCRSCDHAQDPWWPVWGMYTVAGFEATSVSLYRIHEDTVISIKLSFLLDTGTVLECSTEESGVLYTSD